MDSGNNNLKKALENALASAKNRIMSDFGALDAAIANAAEDGGVDDLLKREKQMMK
jgi:hypothetical protein